MPCDELLIIREMFKFIRNKAKPFYESLKHFSFTSFDNLRHLARRESLKHTSVIKLQWFCNCRPVIFNFEKDFTPNFYYTLNLRCHLFKIINMVQGINRDNCIEVCVHIWHGLTFCIHKFCIIIVKWPPRLNILIK